MSDARRGLPLLSGPPTSNGPQSEACRKCGKEFNLIFTRSRKCNHCGYLYCHSCSDYQALMPRANDGPSGYDVMPVCGFCIEYLTITASGKAQLKSMPLGKLKKYANAYNIRISHAVEKDDVIEALVAARGGNGCLSPDNENYYRRHSVPTAEQRPGLRSMFRSQPSSSAPQPPQPPPRETRPQAFPRPDLAPDPQPPRQQQQQQYPNPNAHPQQYPNPNAHPHAYPHPNQGPPHTNPHWNQYQQAHYPPNHNPHYNPHYTPRQPPPPPPQASRPPPSQPRQAPPPPPRSQPSPPRPQPPPVPSLDELINMDAEAIGKLSISALKSILFTNHVPASQILEKGELVRKVVALVDDERRERERQRQLQELEEMERVQREQERREEADRAARAREEQTEQHRQQERAERAQQRIEEEEDPDRPGGTSLHPTPGHVSDPLSNASPSPVIDQSADAPSESSSPPPKTSVPPPPPPPPRPPTERSGLCVVCQDEEANIAIVDCGHLCMCRGCSDLIMSSSRECPLCRTRIVTEARLLRIFKS